MSTTKKEQQVIEILRRVNDSVADAGAIFYDIAGMDLENWDEIRRVIWSIKTTLDIMVASHKEEKRYR